MDNEDKRKLLDELSQSFSGKKVEEEVKKGQLVAHYDSATNALTFNLSGTKYSIEDINKAKKYLQDKMNSHPATDSERRSYYEIAITCIDSIIDQYVKKVTT